MLLGKKTDKTSDGYKIIRSDRKSVSIEIKRDLSVVIRAPQIMSDRAVERFVLSKREWLDKNLNVAKMRLEKEKSVLPVSKLADEEIKQLVKQAKEDLPKRAERFAALIGVNYNRIAIRTQKTLWGSCSGKSNLNFNSLLMLCPEKARDYIVIHELCHLKEMNHSKRFWSLVEKYCPDYKAHRQWLKTEGKNIIARIR